MVVGVSLIFEGQSAVADMVQVLQPLKVGDSHATSVQVHVLFKTTGYGVTFLSHAVGTIMWPMNNISLI